MKNIKLTIELVPKTSWFANLRSNVTKDEWDLVRRSAYKKAKYKCEICGAVGPKWPVECHEIWHYDDKNHIQRLLKTMALCPNCHTVKHIGLANIRGLLPKAMKHLQKVNKWNKRTAQIYVNDIFNLWKERNNHSWTLDLTWLDENFTWGWQYCGSDK